MKVWDCGFRGDGGQTGTGVCFELNQTVIKTHGMAHPLLVDSVSQRANTWLASSLDVSTFRMHRLRGPVSPLGTSLDMQCHKHVERCPAVTRSCKDGLKVARASSRTGATLGQGSCGLEIQVKVSRLQQLTRRPMILIQIWISNS